MQTLIKDIQYSIRGLRKDLGFTLVAAGTLAIGIGATVAIFSVVYAVLLRPLPYREPDRLVRIWEANLERGGELEMTSLSNLRDWQRDNHSLSDFAAWQRPTSLTLTSQTPALELRASIVSANYFSLLGVSPKIGRTFVREESSANNRVVVISDELHRKQFGGDSNVAGSKIQIERKDFEIIGVMPPAFKSPAGDADCWLPLNFQPNDIDRGQTYLQVVGRLTSGVTIQQAQNEMDSIAGNLASQYPESNRGRGIRLLSLEDQTVGNVRRTLQIVTGAVGLVLLITCANVANLFLVRSAPHQHEFAIRSALGASRGRLIRQVLTDAFLVTFVGGVLGFILTVWGLRVLRILAQGQLPRVDEIGIDGSTLVFVLLVWFITSVLCGLVPALYVCGPSIGNALKGNPIRVATTAVGRLQGSLVVAQVAVALVLLTCAGLLSKSFAQLIKVDPGFRVDDLLVARIALGEEYRNDNKQVVYFHELTKRLKAVPGVIDVGAATIVPMNRFGIDFDVAYHREDQARPSKSTSAKAKFRAVTPEYFSTMRIDLKGRDFSDRDDDSHPRVVIVNQLLAQRAWPNENPIGKGLNFLWADWQTYEVVGVVGNTKSYSLQQDSQPELFVSNAQIPYTVMNVVVRTEHARGAISADVRRTILELDPYQPSHSIAEMNGLVGESTARERFAMTWLAVLAAIALTLAGVGIYSVISHVTTRRTYEVGIRMALGAQRFDVLKMVIRSGMTLTIVGVIIGIAGEFLLARFMNSLLFGVETNDVTILLSVAGLVIVVALAASYFPARRATKVDPLVALRSD